MTRSSEVLKTLYSTQRFLPVGREITAGKLPRLLNTFCSFFFFQFGVFRLVDVLLPIVFLLGICYDLWPVFLLREGLLGCLCLDFVPVLLLPDGLSLPAQNFLTLDLKVDVLQLVVLQEVC